MSNARLAADAGTPWAPGTMEIAATSKVVPKEHQGILNLIAALEAKGATKSAPCKQLVLTEIASVTMDGEYTRFATGEIFGPLALYEDWRVLACGEKHSWAAFVTSAPRSGLTVVYAATTTGDWLKMGARERRSLKSVMEMKNKKQ